MFRIPFANSLTIAELTHYGHGDQKYGLNIYLGSSRLCPFKIIIIYNQYLTEISWPKDIYGSKIRSQCISVIEFCRCEFHGQILTVRSGQTIKARRVYLFTEIFCDTAGPIKKNLAIRY